MISWISMYTSKVCDMVKYINVYLNDPAAFTRLLAPLYVLAHFKMLIYVNITLYCKLWTIKQII